MSHNAMDMYTQTSCSRCTSASGRTLLEEALEKFSDKRSSPGSVRAMQVTVTRSRSSVAAGTVGGGTVGGLAGVGGVTQSRTMPDLSVEKKSGSPDGGSNRRCLRPGGWTATGGPRTKMTSVLSTPARHCDACSMQTIRRWRQMHSGTCLNSTSDYEQSHCDLHLDLSSDETRPTTASLFAGERPMPSVFMVKDRPQTAVSQYEVFLPLATVPKKGMIKLTALEYEHREPDTQKPKREKRPRGVRTGITVKRPTPKTLISRKDILEQVRIGALRLEEEEKRRAMEISLNKCMEQYTFGELQESVTQYAEEAGRRSSASKKYEMSKLLSPFLPS